MRVLKNNNDNNNNNKLQLHCAQRAQTYAKVKI